MELNKNMIGLQGVLSQCAQNIGDFTKINYRGGNEEHINLFTSELSNFLTSRNLLDRNKSPSGCEELNEILFFLAINTNFKRELPDSDEYSHLIGIVPKLSKCLLANACFNLDLIKNFGWLIEKLPLQLTEELLDQVIDCLKHTKPKKLLSCSYVIISAVIKKLSMTELSYKTEDTVDDIVKVTTIILQNATCIAADQAESMKAKNIHQQMGFVLLKLFELLLSLDVDNQSVCKLLPPLTSTTSNIMKCITLDVFCSWVEINYEDQPLQAVIGGAAYSVVEKYQKHKVASELVSMLSSIARRPKTITERIREADVPTIIKMVDEGGEHQKLWFRALINMQALSEPKVTECIQRWWELGDENDLKRLLSLLLAQGTKHKDLILKLSLKLSPTSLTSVLANYLYQENLHWQENIADQLVLTFNRIHDHLNDDELKSCLLLMLQNPWEFYRHLFTVAFKRSAEASQIFQLVKDLSAENGLSPKALWEVVDGNPPTSQNVPNYVQLFRTLLNSGYFTWSYVIVKVMVPLLDKFKDPSRLEELKNCLNVLKHFKDEECDLSTDIQLFDYLLTKAAEHRCNSFLDFDPTKNEITSCCVDFISHKCHNSFQNLQGKKESYPSLGRDLDDPWSNYYKHLFWDNHCSFLDFIMSGLDLSNYREGEVDEHFTRMLKTLPRCVASEWTTLLQEVTAKNGFTTASTVITDVLILLCDFGDTNKESNTYLEALKFCLHNYGNFILSTPNKKADQLLTAHNLCRVLKHIPAPLKVTEGLLLINGVPEQALKCLSEDKEFVARIILINDKQLCQAFAQKVLAAEQQNKS